MEKNFIDFSFKAPYFLLGAPGPKIRQIWFVCHGYGQLAKYFIRKFSALDDGSRLIVAPEGLSRFYLQGTSGKSGATWMTREERETDIENYLTYLEVLGTCIANQQEMAGLHITFLGFSQGAATAARWLTETSLKVDRFILWAGILPPDLDREKARKKLKASENYLVLGSQDPYITEARIEEQRQIWSALDVRHPQVKYFEGVHEINQEALMSFL